MSDWYGQAERELAKASEPSAVKMLSTLLAIPVVLMWSAWVLKVLWGWFMVEGFGLPPMSVALAAGVHLIASKLTYQWDSKRDSQSTLQSFFVIVVANAMMLGLGWLVHLFM